jgi:acyl carrier protein
MTETQATPETEALLRLDLVPIVVGQVVRLISPERPAEVTTEQELVTDLGFHSLALAELGFTLEDLFGLDAITPERAMSMRSVGDIVALIGDALAGGNARLPGIDEVVGVCRQYGTEWSVPE